MAELARQAQFDPIVREEAIRIIASTHAINYVDAARRMLLYVRRQICRIDEGYEFIQRPEWMIAEIRSHRRVWGDCDDQSTLLSTLTTAIGLPTQLVAVGRPYEPFEHVFPEVMLGGQWRMVDPQNNVQPPGPWARLEVPIL